MKDIGVGIRKIGFLVLSVLVGLTLWQMFTTFSQIPSFIFPTPTEVWERFIIVLQNGSLLKHTLITLQEVVFGLLLGLTAAIVTGYFLAKSRLVERVLSPYIVASQSIPIVAIALAVVCVYQLSFTFVSRKVESLPGYVAGVI